MRLIDADALYKDMETCCDRSQFGRSTAKMCIKRAQTVEAEPVKHGTWREPYISSPGHVAIKCSVCKNTIVKDVAHIFHYCPACGAKMDLDIKEEPKLGWDG